MQPNDSSLKTAPVAYAPFNRSHFTLYPRSSPEGQFRLLAQPEQANKKHNTYGTALYRPPAPFDLELAPSGNMGCHQRFE
jgi:hypothetical protein